MTETNKIGIIILAAGASRRLGTPKQLLEFENQTLLERIAKTALKTGLETVVVLGANAGKIKKTIENMPVRVVLNQDWQCGMSSSIIKGLKTSLTANPDLSGVILLLCDQPFITEQTLLRLVETQANTGKRIIASRYQESNGVPALFMSEFFGELLELDNETGAKTLIGKHSADRALIDAPEAAFDVDTAEDFENLQKRE